VADVAFVEWTEGQKLRHSRFFPSPEIGEIGALPRKLCFGTARAYRGEPPKSPYVTLHHRLHHYRHNRRRTRVRRDCGDCRPDRQDLRFCLSYPGRCIPSNREKTEGLSRSVTSVSVPPARRELRAGNGTAPPNASKPPEADLSRGASFRCGHIAGGRSELLLAWIFAGKGDGPARPRSPPMVIMGARGRGRAQDPCAFSL
jgi:hypothetical protein